VHLEGHGREALFEDIDVTRTVGWFTSMYPMLLSGQDVVTPARRIGAGLLTGLGGGVSSTTPAVDTPAKRASDVIEILDRLRSHLRSLPNHGIGYGILRYLHPDATVRNRLAALPDPLISFNYLGQFDSGEEDDAASFRVATENRGSERDSAGQRLHLLEISASIVDGSLQINWRYSVNRHRQQTIQQLANDYASTLQALVDKCRSDHESGYRSAQALDAGLDQADLDALLEELGS